MCVLHNVTLSRCTETAATATLCRLPSRTTSPGVWIVRDSLSHVRTLLLVRFSIFPTNAILMEQRFQRRVNKISFTGHSQCDHPQLFCGQGQHHRRVDSSKCYDWRGRLRGKCLIHLFKFLLQLSACIPGHSGGGEDGQVDLLGEHQIELCQTLMYQYTRMPGPKIFMNKLFIYRETSGHKGMITNQLEWTMVAFRQSKGQVDLLGEHQNELCQTLIQLHQHTKTQNIW